MENLNLIAIIIAFVLPCIPLAFFIINNQNLKQDVKYWKDTLDGALDYSNTQTSYLLSYANLMKNDFTDPVQLRKLLRKIHNPGVLDGEMQYDFDDKDITKIKQALRGVFLLHFEKTFKLCAESKEQNSLISQIMWFDAEFLPPLTELSKKEGFQVSLFEMLHRSVEMVPDYEALEKLFKDVVGWGLLKECKEDWKKYFFGKALIMSHNELTGIKQNLIQKTAPNRVSKEDAVEIFENLGYASEILQRSMIDESARDVLKKKFEQILASAVDKLRLLAVDESEIAIHLNARKLFDALYPKTTTVEVVMAQ